MRRLLTLLVAIVFVCQSYCSYGQVPLSDFSHIEIVIDSADFEKLISNSFIRDTFGMTTYDTMIKSPLAIGYYINGVENFINFNPNKGYFASQRGSVYLIFQSRRPGQGKRLEKSLKSITKDSIISYDFKAPSFTLTEIIFKNHSKLQNSRTNHLIPMLSSYAVDTYRKWGLGDSIEVDMKTFIGFDSTKNERLFSKITSVEVVLTPKELVNLESVMKVAGYEKHKSIFTKNGQPAIHFSIDDRLNGFKIRKLNISLNRKVIATALKFGNMSLLLKDRDATFSFK